jgi:FkbH-like protein
MAAGTAKCVVWDLDNTVWDGVLLEDGDAVRLRPEVEEILQTLDERGILHSIASRNEHDHAWAKLEELGLDHYFIYPKIHWNPKSSSVAAIAEDINIGIDTLVFVDDQPHERDEVTFAHPQVTCVDSADLSVLLEMPELQPRFITSDSRIRREMYQADIARNAIEHEFEGPKEEFLRTLDMTFRISPAGPDDLQRAEELTVRTNQLNATGYTYGYEELEELSRSDDHILLVCSLDDKHGTYGKIGLALVEKNDRAEQGGEIWTILLMLMSCRVMAKGVGTVLMNHLLRLAKDAGARLQAEFVPTDRNRQMLITYKFAGFKEVDRIEQENGRELVVLENDLARIQDVPDYVELIVD